MAIKNIENNKEKILNIVYKMRDSVLTEISDHSITEVIDYMRTNFYFSESFNQNDFSNKIVNCVGANIILFECIKKIYPNKNFKYVSPKFQNFNSDGHLTKHICVAEINKNQIRFMDATPLAGFFNGRVSKWLNINMWSIEGKTYYHNGEMSILDYQDKYAYAFSFLKESYVLNVLEFIFLQNEKDKKRFNIKKMPDAWYAESLKDQSASLVSKRKRDRFLKKSYSISKNPFTYIKMDINNKKTNVVEDFAQQNIDVINRINFYIKNNGKNISSGILKEYEATKYWKKEAVKKIQGDKTELPHIFYKNQKLYLYKIGKSFFNDNNVVLLIMNDKQTLKVVDKLDINNFDYIEKKTGVEAYKELLLRLSPEVII